MRRFIFSKGTVLVILLLVAFLPVELFSFNVYLNGSSANTGFEPWYHYVGGMVNSKSGNLLISAEDISILGRGFNIKVVRSYNSHSSGVDGPFGYGWTFNYNLRLVEEPGGNVTLSDGDGSAHTFLSLGGGIYSPPAGVHLKLTKNLDGTFALRFKEGVCWSFDSFGKPVSVVDRNGNQLTFMYDGDRPITVADDSGLALIFDYDGGPRVTRVLDPMGRQISYEYDADGNLFRVTDAMGYSTLYFYSGGLLESAVNRFGGTLSFTYSSNKVVEIEASLYDHDSGLSHGAFTLYSIDYGAQNATVTNSRGFKTVVQMNELGNPISFVDALGGVTSMGWDGDMNMVSLTDANGHTWNYTYDGYGNLLSEKDPLGNSTLIDWKITDTETEYLHLVENVTNGLGFKTSLDYYMPNGNVASVTDALGNSSSFWYDPYGNIIGYVDFQGYPTFYSYDSHGRMVNSTDALGNVTLYSYDILGRLTNFTDANGYMTTFIYDNNDRLIQTIGPLGGGGQYVYNPEGSLVCIIDSNGNQMNVSNNLVNRVDRMEYESGFGRSYVYDRRGNVIRAIDANGAETTYSYDALDRLVSVTDAMDDTETYTYDWVGNLLSKTDKSGNTTLFDYDELNRRIRVTDALGFDARCGYDAIGQIISLQDANGHATNYEYDPLNRLAKITDASGNETRFEYDANGNLVGFTDANWHESSYEYDPLNRLVRVVEPDGNETRLGYDAVGNNVEVVKPDGMVINYEYDQLNRIVAVLYPDGSNATAVYDLGGRVIEVANNGIGFKDVTYYQYDERDLVTSVMMNYDGMFNKTISYLYDAVGNRVMMDAEGAVTIYDYDLLGQLISIQDPSGDFTAFEYDKVGRRTRVNYPNGMSSVYTYDATGSLLSLVNRNSTGGVVSSFTYSYDAVGNRLDVTRENGDVTLYEYDGLNRLVRAESQPYGSPWVSTTEYVYDAVGNRLQRIVNGTYATLYTYDANDRLLTADGGSAYYHYDANGNLITKEEDGETWVWEYDFENRPISTAIIGEAFLEVYRYTPVGNRYLKAANRTVFYLYDFEDILMELDETGTPQATYVHGPSVDDPLSMNIGGNRSYYHVDGLGSVVSLTDDYENVVATYEYDAFGSILEETGVAESPYRFTGREYDEEAGLYYYRARYYDPETGRFTTVDPIRGCVLLPQTYNPYVYVMNNPVNFVDPDGKGWFIVALAAAAVVYIGYKVYKSLKRTKKAMDDGVKKGKKRGKILEDIASGRAQTDAATRDYERTTTSGVTEAGQAGFDMYTSTPNTLATGAVPTSGGEAVGAAAGSAAQDAMAPTNPGRIKDKEELIRSSITRRDGRFSEELGTITIVPTNYATPHSDVGFACVAESIFAQEDLGTFAQEDLGTFGLEPRLRVGGAGYLMYDIDRDVLESHGGPSVVSIEPTPGIHDVAVLDVSPSKTVAGQGYPLSINVTVANQGELAETFNVTVYYNNTAIILPDEKNYTTVTLESGNSTAITFPWDTIGLDRGECTIKAEVGIVWEETDISDNMLIDGVVLLTAPGDVNGDKTVNILDAGKLNAHWTAVGRPYDGNADINNDGSVNILDAGIVSAHWFESW